jgi:thiamine-phosphate pyrophosphorylase
MNGRLKHTGGIYLITPDTADTDSLCAQVKRLTRQPVALLQYRNKSASGGLRRQQAEALLVIAQASGIPLIINDDWRLAEDIGADGVHLGAEDAAPGLVRAEVGERMIIGVSCYNNLSRAERLRSEDIDYLAFGAVFSSKTKPAAAQAGLDILMAARQWGKPVVAIGGITPDNGREVLAAGADYLAVITGVFSDPNPENALANYVNLFQRHPA